jgi:hypothetical protein
MLGAGYIIGAAAMEIAVWIGFFIELFGIAIAKHFGDDALVFSGGTVAIDNAVGLSKPGCAINPIFQWSPHDAPSARRPACAADRR